MPHLKVFSCKLKGVWYSVQVDVDMRYAMEGFYQRRRRVCARVHTHIEGHGDSWLFHSRAALEKIIIVVALTK